MYTGLLHAEKSCAIWESIEVEAAAVQLQLDWMKGHMRLCMALFGFVATVGEHVAGDHFALAWKPWKVSRKRPTNCGWWRRSFGMSGSATLGCSLAVAVGITNT